MTTLGAIKREEGDLPAGTQIGRYRVEDPVGRGGMGTVYRAFDSTTNRNVALKLLAPGIPPSLRERFLAECEAEANIRHEHVMPVYDRGWLTEERPYFVMELLYEPITLGELMEEINHGTLGSNHPRLRAWNDPRRLIGDVLLPIVEGIHVANTEYSVQHRDLKPDNVLVDIRTRRAYLIDFGICRDMDDEKDRGRIVGTPRFLSPEQASAQTHERTDIWGLGAILRYVITGEPPLAGTSPFTRAEVNKRIEALQEAEIKAQAAGEDAKARGYARRRAQLEDPTLRVQEDLLRDAVDGVYLPLPESIGPGLAAVIGKAMARDPAQRYANAGELAKDLKTWLAGGGVHALQEASSSGAAVDWARRLMNKNVVRGVGTLAALLVGLVVGAGLFATTPPPPDHRWADLADDGAALHAARQALAREGDRFSSEPGGFSVLDHLLLERGNALKARGEAIAASADGAPIPGLGDRPDWQRRLRFQGWAPTPWEVKDLTGFATVEGTAIGTGNAGTLRTGVYEVISKRHGVHLLIAVPYARTNGFVPGKDRRLERALLLGKSEGAVPGDMVWVPAGAADLGDDALVKPFLAGRDFVTNERYSEWLDDIPSADRAERIPPTGFVRDERDAQRWLVAQDMGSKPVLGVKPSDAKAYAAWRASVEGTALGLPTDTQWRRMAAIDRMQDEGAGHIFPWRAAPQWKRAHRRGDRTVLTRSARIVRALSPHGVRRMFSGPGEIVLTDDGAGFIVKGKGGMVPLASAVRRSTPIAADAAGHALGFRLVTKP